MRITEHRLLEITTGAAGRAREQAARAGEQVSSGIGISRASDDPARWSQAKAAQARTTLAAGHERAVTRANDRLAETDGALSSIGEVLSHARELAVQMGNGTMSPTERQNASAEIAQLRESLIAMANRRGGDGEYLLAGNAGNAAPFDAAGAYLGSDQDRVIVAGETQTQVTGLTGTFLTAASGTDALALLGDLSAALAGNDVLGARAALSPLDDAINQVASARTTVGVRMQARDQADLARGDREESRAAEIDRAVGIDPIEAATRLNRAALALEAARAAAAKITAMLDNG